MQSLALIENWPVPTAAAAVVRADGTVVGTHGPTDRRFALASVTKPLAAYAALVAGFAQMFASLQTPRVATVVLALVTAVLASAPPFLAPVRTLEIAAARTFTAWAHRVGHLAADPGPRLAAPRPRWWE